MIDDALALHRTDRVHRTAMWSALLLPVMSMVLMAGCAAKAGSGGCGDPDWSPPPSELARAVPLPQPRGSAGIRSAVPMTLLVFDRHGNVCSDQARAELEKRLKQEQYTDIYVLCTGWNEGWYSAVAWMDAFAAGYEQARTWAASPARRTENYKPLYIGIVWPGAVMNSAYPARTTRQEALRPDVDRTALLNVLNADPTEKVIERIRQALLDKGHQRRAIQLDNLLDRKNELTPPEQIEFADCLLPLFGPQAEPSAPGPRYAMTAGREPVQRLPEPGRSGMLGTVPAALPPMTAAELLDVWKESVRAASASIRRAPDEPLEESSLARRRGLSVPQLVRWALYATDLRVVSDRAYQVGQSGLADTLAQLRTSSDASMHLVGHSFGAEVVLAALTSSASKVAGPAKSAAVASTTQPRRVAYTVLLLSPIINAWALGTAPMVGKEVLPSLQTRATPGQYHLGVMANVAQSVVVVYSTRDWFAAYYAPLALRRPSFEGMASPDVWAGQGHGFETLGGVGPSGLQPPASRHALIAPGAEANGPMRYNLGEPGTSAAPSIVGVDASATIWAHGHANDRATWWLLANQVESGQ